jgi:hypothetical protein
MLVVRFYYRCKGCGLTMYINNRPYKNRSIYCERCKPYAKRAQSIFYRLGEKVDFEYVKTLLSQNRCTYCNRELSWSEKQVEHKIPVTRGGGNENSNLCLSCMYCNYDKGNMTYEEYMSYKKLNPYIPGSYHRDMALKHLSQFKLYDEKIIEQRITEEVDLPCPKIRNEQVLNEFGKIVGYRKWYVYSEPVTKVSRLAIRTLTKEGELYNLICKIAKKPVIKTKEKLD